MIFKKENIARIGLSAIGFVYVLVGVLTAMAALNLGGQKTGTKGAIGFLSNQPLGKTLLAIIALGLLCYVFWRMYQTIFDSRNLGTGVKALFTRAGYFTGGLFYGSLAFLAIKLFFGSGQDQNQDVIVGLLNSKYGSSVAVILGLILAGKSVFEIYFVLSNQFKKNVHSSEIPEKAKNLLLKFGVIGHGARSVVFGIMSFLTIRAGFTARNEDLSTVTDAFQFLKYEFGAFVLGFVAVGFICYGLYMFVKARYLYVNMH
ncbi:uncharacterized protein DUF1206 [Gelidibacter algens]|uniref:Uncharacterized protein DUF1206 n=1 Tax=Gelidibacter algens TaxID=49280 RepID=A0A1A7QYE2_9FLAO|nr:DUF1206 domain-containing protein [Gelidibacter algens]OBX24576.1 hypothetical protein A9996_14610 [Gelidibacter algens]RAJ19716.1 uncharacterized protein DUF1206 [Gelidibacter algens]